MEWALPKATFKKKIQMILLKILENVACENSRPSSLQARMAFREKDVSLSRNATRAWSEEGRLFSKAMENEDSYKDLEFIISIKVNIYFS